MLKFIFQIIFQMKQKFHHNFNFLNYFLCFILSKQNINVKQNINHDKIGIYCRLLYKKKNNKKMPIYINYYKYKYFI